IREFATPETQIMVLSHQGDVLKTYTMETLLPDAFGPEQLPPR
ncbi:MAG: cytidine deaminase, partial [Halomonas venusta]|nr:cytidine deaminase [Halomonas venusta]